MARSIRVQIDFAQKGLVENVSKLIGEVAFAAFQAIVSATPVDTGRARGNWIPAIGREQTQPTDDVDKSGTGRLGQTQQLFGNYELADGKIFITNNLPYIQRLNEGHSMQAPAGFVEQGILAGVRAFDLTGDIAQ